MPLIYIVAVLIPVYSVLYLHTATEMLHLSSPEAARWHLPLFDLSCKATQQLSQEPHMSLSHR